MPIIHGQEYSTRYNAFDRWSHSIQANEDEDTAPQILFIPSALHSGCAVARYAIPLMPETASAPESQETSHFAEEYSMDTERPGPGRAVAHTSSAADTQAAPGVIARYPPPQVADACDDNFALSWPGLAAAVETLSGVAIGLPTNHAWRTYTGASIQFGARRADGVVCPVSLLDCQLMRVALHDGEKEPSCLSAVTDGRFRFQISWAGYEGLQWKTQVVNIGRGMTTEILAAHIAKRYAVFMDCIRLGIGLPLFKYHPCTDPQWRITCGGAVSFGHVRMGEMMEDRDGVWHATIYVEYPIECVRAVLGT